MVQGQTRTSQIAARFFCCLILGFLDLQMYSTIMGGKKARHILKKLGTCAIQRTLFGKNRLCE